MAHHPSQPSSDDTQSYKGVHSGSYGYQPVIESDTPAPSTEPSK